jgi:hypothetical protein
MARACCWPTIFASLTLVAGTATAQDVADMNRRAAAREPVEPRVRPGALAALIDELGGRYVTVPKGRVLGVLNPRAFLIESDNPLPAARGNLGRVLVLIDRGQLGVAPALLVDATVKVGGVARTVLGMQVSREVPWPPELPSELVKRLEVRAVVLAESVETSDGVNLVQRLPSVD